MVNMDSVQFYGILCRYQSQIKFTSFWGINNVLDFWTKILLSAVIIVYCLYDRSFQNLVDICISLIATPFQFLSKQKHLTGNGVVLLMTYILSIVFQSRLKIGIIYVHETLQTHIDILDSNYKFQLPGQNKDPKATQLIAKQYYKTLSSYRHTRLKQLIGDRDILKFVVFDPLPNSGKWSSKYNMLKYLVSKKYVHVITNAAKYAQFIPVMNFNSVTFLPGNISNPDTRIYCKLITLSEVLLPPIGNVFVAYSYKSREIYKIIVRWKEHGHYNRFSHLTKSFVMFKNHLNWQPGFYRNSFKSISFVMKTASFLHFGYLVIPIGTFLLEVFVNKMHVNWCLQNLNIWLICATNAIRINIMTSFKITYKIMVTYLLDKYFKVIKIFTYFNRS